MFVPDSQATVLSTSEKFSSIQFSFKQSRFTEIYDYESNCKSEKLSLMRRPEVTDLNKKTPPDDRKNS